jgi:hypothetical protein
MKTSGMMARILSGGSGDQLGFWHTLDKRMQHILITYSKRSAQEVTSKYQKSVKAFMQHKEEVFKMREQKCEQLEFDKYHKCYSNHRKLFTTECLMTESEIDAALNGMTKKGKPLSASAQIVILKAQFDIWVHGAGWKDVRAAYQRKGVKYSEEHLTIKLKEIISRYVQTENPRRVRAQVPRPSQLSGAKPMPDLGDTLCDALALKEKALADEQERINAAHDKLGIPCRLEAMPDRTTLDGSKIAMLFKDEDLDSDDTDEVRMWYFGKVIGISCESNGEAMAEIEWDVGGDTTTEELEEDKWAGPNSELLINSWMIVSADN